MARKAKQRKWDKAKASKQRAERKTAASREKRLANKHKREAVQSQLGDVQIVIKDGMPYMNGDKLDLINGIYTVVPAAAPEDVHTAAEILESYEACHRNTCEHGNALASNCSDCDEDVLGMSVTAEEPRKVILRNDPASMSRFERLKDKLRGN